MKIVLQLRRIIEQTMDAVGDWMKMTEAFPELEVYLRYDYLIPIFCRTGASDPLERVERWADFFVEQPELAGEKYCLHFAESIAASRMFVPVVKDFEVKNSFFKTERFYRRQLSRLPARTRRKVLRYIPGIVKRRMKEKRSFR